ncbi:D-lactate dehydrogenase [Leucobacter sp. CSA1]|uniref:Quinone-dependent D-lactate dehydrogenase n=1 Tax=Leucobacter chromiisoli TaxID=2796471 RepID=A0A934Q7A4_9MICO|nr:D-lactate dehydrogenase [Leucobacter chromiisoli]MBK0419066.1 D-lactate dehydrogenase [Leucobacter chromiisoli]
MRRTRPEDSATAVSAFVDIMGKANVLTTGRSTERYVKGNRFGSGRVLAVLRPGNLVEIWRALQVCVERDLIVIPQAANTGLTGGSGPGDQDYDREIVIISTLRINQIYLINDAREAVCLAGSTLHELEEILAPHGREPHSVIGSTSIGASVVGGIANNSGGSQVRKGPAFTAHAIYAQVGIDRKIKLVNHLGIELGDDPVHVLDSLQSGVWGAVDAAAAPQEGSRVPYSDHVRRIVGTPARFNADPGFLFEASGCAGKIFVFAVRTPTFPKEKNTTTFYIGTERPSELEQLRRDILRSESQLPISGEYLGRSAFDLAAKYGKDTFVGLKYAGSRQVGRLFAVKSWANGIFAKLPFFGPTFADTIAQRAFGLLPEHLPQRMRDYRDRFEHHLLMVVGDTQKQETEAFLSSFFAQSGRSGSFFVCTDDEATSAMLHRFGAASAMTRYYNLHRKDSAGMITFDVALRRDDEDWLETLPPEIAEQLAVSSYYGHFFCHVLHQDHVAKEGVDPTELKKRMTALLEARGAAIPAEHNFGRLYQLPSALEAHFTQLDPCNIFNPGIGGTSPHKNWGESTPREHEAEA